MIRSVSAFVLLLTGLAFTPSLAIIPLPTSPDWESNPNGQYGTGLGVADLNHDGWIDLVVANGNDMARQKVAVYRNKGDGTMEVNPSWTSTDIDYHGHLDLADVDGDGNVDCAVAVYIGSGGFGTLGKVKLYHGNGDGTFSATPIWQSSDAFYCFSVAFGDMDMDGDPDLACATGDDYYDHPEQRRIYRNAGGTLETTPAWLSTEVEYSLDVTWCDLNNDGALDLAFAGTSCPNRVYFSVGGAIQTTAGWSSTDASIYANTIAAGDVDGDGFADLAVADNNQLGGSGRFKLYRNPGAAAPATTPLWQSTQSGYGSHVSFIDIDEDGDLDLSTGIWWGPVRIYENVAGSLGVSPSYTSATGSVIENEVWEDIDNDGLQRGLGARFQATAGRKLYQLPQRPARAILSISVGGAPVDPATVYLDSDDSWFILASAPATGAEVYVTYLSSADVDLALSNWDSTEGEYLFRNTRNPLDVSPLADLSPAPLRVAPNPSSGLVRIWITDRENPNRSSLELVDLTGRRLRSWAPDPGVTLWDGRDGVGRSLPPGVYWLRWVRADGQAKSVKIIRQ